MRSDQPKGRSRNLRLPYDITVGAILLLLAGLSVAEATRIPEVDAASSAAEASLADEPPPPAMTLQSMTCFTCHSLQTYRNGNGGQAFPHDFHYDMLGIDGCHACHAFSEHGVVVNELPECADCH